MALVVFLRGVNVGGHRTFRPSVLARELNEFDVVNVGAAGTFVVKKAVTRASLLDEFRRRLPFTTEIMCCNGPELVRLVESDPFDGEPTTPTLTRFVSVLPKASRARHQLPLNLPPEGDWFLRIIAARRQFVVGEYRRHMKAIGYLGQIDKLFGAPATTRSWNTIMAIAKIMREGKRSERT